MKLIKQSLIMVWLLVFPVIAIQAQLAYSPFVDSISQLATDQKITLLLRQLSGDTTVTISGNVKTISSRHYLSEHNHTAELFIYKKLQEYGYQPLIQHFSGSRGVNIVATKMGTKFPDQQYIICAHYDDMPSGSLAPGADDNASGIVAVLEAARILSTLDLAYTVKFALWDEEEIGLIGSAYYALNAYNAGTQIKGVLNLDMIAWDSDNNFEYSISVNPQSSPFSNDFITTTSYYQPQLVNNFISSSSSDHSSFWQYGYPAIMVIEDFYDFNAYYHTVNDNVSTINLPYFRSLVRAAIANMAANALDQRIEFVHNPVLSSNTTGPREAVVTINSNNQIAGDPNAPRLYYTTDSLNFYPITPTGISGNTYTFLIPGFALGTTVSYYFAAQDASASMVATYPAGGRGINPPGSVNPVNFITYMVDNIHYNEKCSVNTPLPLNNNSNTYDQVNVDVNGRLLDLDVLIDITHPRTYELRLILISPDNTSLLLSDRNGGEGDNYTQTIFDDQSQLSIKDGIAPFTGRYRPEFTFSPLLDHPIGGTWKLRVVESGDANTGILNEWCLHFLYKDLNINAGNILTANKAYMEQNYPNPVVETTTIKIHLPERLNLRMVLYDNMGNTVRTFISGNLEPGDHLIVTSLAGLRPGIYYYSLESEAIRETKKLIKVNE